MSDHYDAIEDSVRSTLSTSPDPTSGAEAFDRRAWRELNELGFTALALPGELGGSDGDLRDAAAACRAAPLAALPLTEANFLAVPALTDAGVSWPGGVVTAASAPELVWKEIDGGPALCGRIQRVPWLRNADHLVVILPHGSSARVAIVATAEPGLTVVRGTNLAGEPRDEAILRTVRPSATAELPETWSLDRVAQYGAVARAVQIAAAAAETLTLAAQHTTSRIQFGRTLSKFQSVQHQLAQLAADVVTLRVAADAAVNSLLDGRQADLLAAVAKIESSVLARRVSSTAHQLHGAIGFTNEHRLGAYTTRMWSWREEYGNETRWERYVADLVTAQGDDVWALLTDLNTATRTDAHT